MLSITLLSLLCGARSAFMLGWRDLASYMFEVVPTLAEVRENPDFASANESLKSKY